MMRDAKPMGAAKKAKPKKAQVAAKTGRGRPKEPIEKRISKSDRPHLNRISPPDIPTGATLDPGQIPEHPPIELNEYEREIWDRIVKSQRAMEVSAWLFRSDAEFLVAACVLYGRWRMVRDELESARASGEPMVDPETGRANPLISIEKSLLAAYQQSLKELAMVPARRQVTAVEAEDEDEDWIKS